jgi:hypothetical protein
MRFALNGNSMWPMLRIATVLGPFLLRRRPFILSPGSHLGGKLEVIGDEICTEWEFHVANVADRDCVGPSGRLDDGAEGPLLAVLWGRGGV